MKKLSLFAVLLGYLTAWLISCAHQTENTAPSANIQKPVNIQSRLASPYVVMISIDGYRYDYTEKYHPTTISAIATNGVQAKSLQPSYPTLTFPNHYTLITGMYPSHHGIVSNFFYDRNRNAHYAMNDSKTVNDGSWYTAQPLWRWASLNGMLSATAYWVGSEAAVNGGLADYVLPWKNQLSNEGRVDKVIEWLQLPELNRPHFISLYFSEVDTAGHKGGPDSEGVKNAITEIDNAIGKLRNFIIQYNLPVNLVLVSDHGMQNLEKDKYINLYEIIDLTKFDVQERGAITHLYSTDADLLQKTVQKVNQISHLKAYLRKDIPARFHYNDSEKIGDVLVVPDMPYYIVNKPSENSQTNISAAALGGTHGWDNKNMEMHGIFYAEGPSFKKAMLIPTVENIHVAPMLQEALGLPLLNVDGKAQVLHSILVKGK